MTDDSIERELLRRRRRARAEGADYPVGYAKPPEEHQFKKGSTRASRAGRGGGSSFLERTLALAAEKVSMIDAKGRRRWFTQDEAIRRRMVHDAMRGDPRARAEWFKQVKEVERLLAESHAQAKDTRANAQYVIDKLEKMASRYEEIRAEEEAARAALEGQEGVASSDYGANEIDRTAGAPCPSRDGLS